MTSSSNVCPQCAAPVADTDLACRGCGRSFVADADQVTRDVQATFAARPPLPRSNVPEWVPSPIPMTSWNLPNPYAPPMESLPLGSPLAKTPPAEANLGVALAVFGFFLFGGFGGLGAMIYGFRARAKITANPGMPGSRRAMLAVGLGAADILMRYFFRFSVVTWFLRHR
jgi:hypothetical protein